MGTDLGLLLGARGALGRPCGSGEVCALLPLRTYSSFTYAAENAFSVEKILVGACALGSKKGE